MICPNCATKTNKNICPKCGSDNTLYNKIYKISNSLYNKGLSQAKSDDLTGAIISLKRSLKFDKNNHLSRNLLGLVYLACGQIGDALKHWVVSLNIRKEENFAKDYITIFEKDTLNMEKLNDSIKMYNQALTYIIQKSEDMAIIQLKKATDLNPGFVDALNLLALCYMISKDNRKAILCIEKVLKIDVANPIALAYFKELSPKSRVQHFSEIKADSKKNLKPSHTSPKIDLYNKFTFGNSFGIKIIAILVSGIVLSFVIVYLLLMPAALNSKDEEISALTISHDTKEKSYVDQITRLTRSVNDLTSENEQLQNEKDNLDVEVEKQSRTQTVLTASALFSEKDYEGTAGILEGFNLSGLDQNIIELYNNMMETSYSEIESTSYSEGLRQYNNWRYEEAKPLFEKAVKYATNESIYTGNALYYLGRIAEINEDINAARVYYEKVLSDYPDSSEVNRAQYQLDRLP